MSKKKTVALSVAALFAASLGFSETYVVKTGKITALSLDTDTNQTTVTVTLGDLQLPDVTRAPFAKNTNKKPRGKNQTDERSREQKAPTKRNTSDAPDIITLGTDTQSFVLTAKTPIELYRPLFARKKVSASDVDVADESIEAAEADDAAQMEGGAEHTAVAEAPNDAASGELPPAPNGARGARPDMRSNRMPRGGRFADNADARTQGRAGNGYAFPPANRMPLANARCAAPLQLALGSVVQLIFAEDGTTLQCIQLVPAMPHLPSAVAQSDAAPGAL